MVARLVFDAIWRSRWAYAAVGVILVLLWLPFQAAPSNLLPISITALSLVVASALGPMFAIEMMSVRELRHLPVTVRDIWRTTWVAATVVSVGVLLATKTIGALLFAASGGTPRVSAEAMLLSAVYDFTWAGVVLPVLALLGYAGHAAARRGTVVASLAAAGSFVGMIACFATPILVSGALPAHVGEFTSATTGVLTAGLGVAFGALAWTPQRGMLAGERASTHRAVAPADAATPIRLADRLTGISRVAVPHLLATLALAVGACLALAVCGMMAGSDPLWFVPRANDLFDPADVGDRGLTYFVLLPCAIVTMQGLWTPWSRLLKVLPLSVRQVNALLLLTPGATWASLWLLGLSLYALAHGAPTTLRVDLAFGLAGTGALVHAVLLCIQGSPVALWVVVFVGGLLPPLMKVGLSDSTAAHRVFAIIGVIAFSAAAFVNHRTLTRSTSSSLAYRRPQPPFGFPAKPAIR